MANPDQTKKRPKKAQIEKFRDKARELGCDLDEEKFRSIVGTIAKQKPKKPGNPHRSKGLINESGAE